MAGLPAALTCLALGACLPAHAPAVRKVGMVSSIAGVVGLMGSALVQSYINTDQALAGFSILSGVGIAVFAYGEIYLPPAGPEPETLTAKHRRWAKILTTRASGAAREGRCPRVRRLEKRVNVYDREVHDFVFMRDAAIVVCLAGPVPAADPLEADTPTEGPPPAEGAPPVEELPPLTLPPGTVIPPTP